MATGDVLADNAGDVAAVTPGVAGQVLTSTGVGSMPTFQTPGGGGGGAGNVSTSVTLTANRLVIGAGTTNVDVLGSLGTTTTLLHGNAAGAPTFGAVSLTADVTGDLPFSNLAQGSALSVLGVTGNATADVASIAAGTDNQVLRRSGTAVAFGAVNLASSDAVTGDLPFANLTQGSALSVLGVTGNATADVASIAAGSDGDVLRRSGTSLAFGAITSAAIPTAVKTRALTLGIDGGGSAITTGVKADLYVPYACTITAVTMLADQSGSIVVDIWKDTLANYPPTDSDSITASAPPTISSATNSQDTTLTGWTTSVSAGNTLRFNVDSASTVTRLNLVLTVTV